MSGVIRKEIVMSPGESLTRSAEFDADAFPAGTTSLDSASAVVERKRGTGTLTVTGVAASADSLEASWQAALSNDATTGSAFVITITGVVGSGNYKVGERVIVAQ